MPTYIYKARDTTGRPVRGTMDACNKEELVSKLHGIGYMATRVTESVPGIKIESLFERLRFIRTEDLIMFNIQLSAMINAGITILNSLDTLGKQIGNRRLRESVESVSRNLEAGDSFSQALARYSRVFSKLFVSMVRAGEVSGKLSTVLSRFAEFIEHQAELRQKIKGALFYPTVLLGAGIAVTLYIVTFVIPQFAEIFLKAGVRLPLLTLVLYRIGIAIKHYWYVLVILLILAWIGFTFYAKTEKGGFLLDRLKLKLPIFGPLYRRAIISRFSRTLGTLLESGIPILEALDISQEVIENKVMARVIENAYHVVEKGQSLSEPLRASIDFPADAVQMIVAGEETGNVDVMLHKISDLYDMYLNYSLRRVTTILEPILLAIMGCVVGFIMASMLLPIFDMVKILRH